jgi:hypothetical protein
MTPAELEALESKRPHGEVIEAMIAEIRRGWADRARLDWLEESGGYLAYDEGQRALGHEDRWCRLPSWRVESRDERVYETSYNNAREAIDAAMKAGGGK